MAEIKLYNMDCMIAMKEMKDKEFDLAIVDPPYGIGDFNCKTQLKNGRRIIINALPVVWNNAIPPKEYFAELLRVSKDQIIWGANYYNCFTRGGALIWHKGNIQDLFSQCEIASLSWQQKVDYVFIQWQSGFVRKSYEKNYIPVHPTQKPVKLYEWLLKNYAKEGDKILDTHLVSGSIAIACYNLGFDLTGYEIDKEYYDAAVKRLEEHKKQQRLFEPDEVLV